MKIVLTGGPSAGKTSLADVLQRSFWDQIHVVPEAASILFAGGFPRHTDAAEIRCQQRAIYHVQRELEEIGAIESVRRSMICDRGSLDGLAYWPGTEEDYFHSLHTDMSQELARYDWVMHLDTAQGASYRSSSVRVESIPEAISLNEKVKTAWRLHPRRVVIPNSSNFDFKIHLSLHLVRSILAGQSLTEVERMLGRELAAAKK